MGSKDVVAYKKSRYKAKTKKENFKITTKRLMGLESYINLITITAVEVSSGIEVIYHHVCQDAIISVMVELHKDGTIMPTIVDLIPGAAIYEREVHDLFGVIFEGNTDLSPLLLPDEWPESVFPLRNWWTNERITKRIKES